MSATPITALRLPPEIKRAAQERAEAEGRTLTDVVVSYLARYGKTAPKSRKS